MGVLLLMGAPREYVLLHDTFDGTGSLDLHQPAPVWRWSGYFLSGTWGLNGDGSVSQSSNPAGATPADYYAIIKVTSSDHHVVCTLTTPSTGNFKVGVAFRANLAGGTFKAVLNKATNNLELIRNNGTSDTVLASQSMGTLLNNTEYTVEGECFGTTVIARCGEVSCTATSSTDQSQLNVALTESVAVGEGHSKFSDLYVYRASDNAAATRIFYAPSDLTPELEWDSLAPSGTPTPTLTRQQVNGNWQLKLTIDTSLGTVGYRLHWQGDQEGPVPNPEAPHWTKNLPDKAYYTYYCWINTKIQRTGTFWNVCQWKQREASLVTVPVYSLNLGWNGADMFTEVNSNVGSLGEYDADHPDISTGGVVFPAGRWVKVTGLYRWHESHGRVAFWLDNVPIYNFNNIQTLLNYPDDGTWLPAKNPRQWGVNHYSGGLSPSTSSIIVDNCSVHGMYPPDDYPDVAAV